MNIETLFENQNLIIINKPSGLVVHSDGKTKEPTVVDWVLEHYPEIQGVGEQMVVEGHSGNDVVIARPGIVHRIDRDTSGCLVIAKTQESFEHLKQQFKDRKIKKTYQALVHGLVKNDTGIIDVPIGKSRKNFRMKMAGQGARGQLRDAVTRYKVLGRYEDKESLDKQKQTLKYSLLELSPQTGRTHQIRVHLKYINHPIVSDPLYSGKRKPALGLERTALHAQGISFEDKDWELIKVTCETPKYFPEAIKKLTELLVF